MTLGRFSPASWLALVLWACVASSNAVAQPSASTADFDRVEDSASGDYQQLSTQKRDLDRRVVARGREYVRLIRTGLLPVGGGFEEFAAHAARVERIRRALERDLAQLEALDRRLSRLGPTSALQSRAIYDQAKRELMAKSQGAIRAAEDREAAFQRAFNSSWNPAHTAVYGSAAAALSRRDVANGFASMRGRLPFPVRGRTEIVSTEDGKSGPYLELTARAGAIVRNVFPGRVAFIGGYAERGPTVMVDHGQGYYTLYAGVDRVSVKVGDRVGDGAPLAHVPDGAQLGTIYFELRAGKTQLAPAAWFGI